MIPPPRAMASMLPVDPIVNDIQHETFRPRSPRLRTRASASLFRFPACHESAARDLSTPLPSPPTHASTPGRARARRWRSISGAPEELARLLRAAYFSPSDDADADSWETQLTRFEETALHMLLKLMCSVEEARQRTIADAVWREIFWLMPRDRTVTIVVRGGKVSVDIGPVCTEAATDASSVEAAQ